MRSDKDKRTDTEREIDDFLSKFDSPADASSADYSTYLEPEEPEGPKKSEGSEKAEAPEKSAEQKKPAKSEKSGEQKKPAKTEKTSGPKVSKGLSFNWKDVDADDSFIENGGDLIVTEKIKEEKTEKKDKQAEKAVKEDNKIKKEEKKEGSLPVKAERKKRRKKDHIVKDSKPAREVIRDGDKTAAAPAGGFSNIIDIKEIKTVEESTDVKAAEDAGKMKLHVFAGIESRFSRKGSDKKKDDKSDKDKAEKESTSNLKYKLKDRRGNRTLGEFLFLKPNPDYDPSKGETYEKDGRTVKNKKNKISFLKILGSIAAVMMVFVLAGMIYALGCIISAPKYNYKDIYSVVDTASVIYDDQENPIDNVFYTENRKIIKYKDMPENLVNSFVAIEDKTFWKHHGFNWTRMIGAIFSSLTGHGKISGTSTITQQLARNVYLADTKSVRSIKRKLLEMYYAARLEHALSKEQIVEAYLNTIYLGHGCYGVNAAAKTYFSKDVKDLDLIECASLAALPQSPDTYALLKLSSEAQEAVDPKVVATEPDTIVTNDIAKGRRQLTLDLMLNQGMITKEDHDKVYELKLNDFINPSISITGSIYSYFHEYLVDTIIADLMDQKGMTYEDAERTVYTRGLQIYSTVDSTAQKVIVDEFADESNFPYVTASRDGDGNMLNNDGEIALYNYDNDFDEEGNFTLSGEAGDVHVNSDGSVTITKGHKLHIYETEVEGGTDYSLEFKPYYYYNEDDVLYSISGGYVNIPMGYKSLDSDGNLLVSADFFSDPDYKDNVSIDGGNLILRPGIYTLSSRSRQPQAAMTIVGVGTGEVKAMVGGRTTGGQKLLNRSLNARQPGSSIKPLAVYGAALQKSYDLNKEGKKWKFTDFGIDKQGTKGWGDYITTYSSVEDERTRIEGRNWPENYNHSFSGKNTFVTAVQKSINTCAVKIELQVGDDYSVNQLKKFGLTTVQDDTSNPVNDVNPAALALGAMTQGVQPLEMALAYASFPAGGKLNTPICYYKVLDRNGDILLEGKSEQTEALNEGVAWIMTNVLQSVVRSNNYMYVSDVQPGGKTGTTNDQYDIWFDGFTPSYAASLWIGTDENVEMSSMSTPAARLWGRIMDQIPKAKVGDYAEQPSNVIYTSGCYFTEGTETGLTSWSDAEARKKAMEKAKQAAYEKWLAERENHKKLIPAVTQEVDDPTKPIYEMREVEVDDPTKPIHQDPNDPSSPIIGYEKKKEMQNVIVGYQKKTVVVTPEHYEYEEGWRDGDFQFDTSDYE